MAFEKISGVIKTVQGQQGQVGNRVATWWQFSILEVGDRVLQGVVVPGKLVVFLNAGDRVGIWLDGGAVVALERADGKLFLVGFREPGLVSLVLGIALIPVMGIGFLMLFSRYATSRKYNAIKREILPKYAGYENLVG